MLLHPRLDPTGCFAAEQDVSPQRRRQSGEWGSNPRSPAPRAGGLPLSYPLDRVDRRRIAPRFPPCDGGVIVLDEQPEISTPGRTRTCADCLHVREVPSPLGHGGKCKSGKPESNRPDGLMKPRWNHSSPFPSQSGRQESNPHNPGSQPGPAAALGSATVLRPGIEPGTRTSQNRVMSLSPSKPLSSTPARSRTWTCSFGGSHDVPFTTRAASDQGGSRTLMPRWARPSEDRVSACSTTWPSQQPVGVSIPSGRFENPATSPEVQRAVSACRAGVEPAQRLRAGYSRLGSPMPSRHVTLNLRGRARTCTLRLPTPARCPLRHSKSHPLLLHPSLRPDPCVFFSSPGGI
jgi:hypothetical protein